MIYRGKSGQKIVLSIGLIITLAVIALCAVPTQAQGIDGTPQWGTGGNWNGASGCFTRSTSGENSWDSLFGRTDLSLVAGQSYVVDFMAMGSGDVTVRIGLQDTPYDSLGAGTFTLTEALQSYSFEVTIGSIPNGNDTMIGFEVGGATGSSEMCVRDVIITDTEVLAAENALELVGYIDSVSEFQVVDNILYTIGFDSELNEGTFLEIIDISNPASPTSIGTSDPFISSVERIEVVDSIAYIINDNRELMIFDVADPTTPTLLNTHHIGSLLSDPRDFRVVGDTAYVVGYSDQLLVTFDVGEPTNIISTGSYALADVPTDMDVEGDVVYLMLNFFTIAVIDLSSPVPAFATISDPIFGSPIGLDVVGNMLYVADHGSVDLVDVNDPGNPSFLGSYTMPDQYMPAYDMYGNIAHDVVVSGNVAYVIDEANSLIVLDVADPNAPSLIASYGNSDLLGEQFDSTYDADIQIVGDQIYLTTDTVSGIHVLRHNIEQSTQPTQTPTVVSDAPTDVPTIMPTYTSTPFPTPSPVPQTSFGLVGTYAGNVTAISVENGVAYIGMTSDEYNPDTLLFNNYLEVVNVSNPAAPILIGRSDVLPDIVHDVYVAGGVVYITDPYGISTFDVSNPAEPTMLDNYGMEAPFQVQVVGNVAYVVDNWNGLVLLDVSNPSNVTQIASYSLSQYMPESPRGMFVVGHTAYLTIGGAGLLAIDVSDPANPTRISIESFDGVMESSGELYLVENSAYTIDNSEGLITVDVSDPVNPILINSTYFSTVSGSYGIVVSNSIAYAFGSPDGLSVFDVSVPSQPVFLNSYGDWGGVDTHDVQVVGDLMYIAGDSSGLQILSLGEIPQAHPVNTPTLFPTPTEPPTNSFPTPTMTPTPFPTSISPTAIPTSTSVPDGDEYENDDVCGEARTLSPNGTSQQHTFNEFGDVDWIEFEAVEGNVYQVVAEAVGYSAADLVAEVYANCEIAFQVEQSHSFAPSVILNVTARQDGMYKVKFYNDDPAVFGDNVAYRVSVTEVTETNTGAVVIVGGRDQADDHLQDNIHDVTNRVYKMFAQNGYSESRIHYLATDFTPNDDPNVIVDGEATAANLQEIITNQLFNQVSDQQPLTIYMMSHGFATGGFYMDEVNNERVLPEQLDAWLDELQANRPGLQINIIIDACYAGQFISNSFGESVSGDDRVVITSSANNELAWSSFNGANFSDYFLVGIHQRKTIYEAFEAARWAVSSGQTVQHAWIDDDGDGLPNSFHDGEVAAERYLLSPEGSFGTTWEPYIESVVVDGMAGVAMIQAQVLSDPDGLGIEQVQAVLYPPSFEPDVDGDRLLTTEGLPTVELLLDENGWYIGSIPLDEWGTYEVSIHAQGNAPANLDVSLQSRPVIETFTNNGDAITPLAVEHVETSLKLPLLSLITISVAFSVFTVTTVQLLKRQS